MFKRVRAQAIATVLFLGGFVPEASATQYRLDTTILSITQDATNQTYILFAQSLNQGTFGSCNPTRKDIVVFDAATSADARKAILSVATAALLSGKTVTVAESGAACANLPANYGAGQTAYKVSYLEMK